MEVVRVPLFGISMSNITFDDLIALMAHRITTREPGYIVTPNVDHICRYQRDERFRNAYANAFLTIPDGVPILWASKLLGKPLKEKLSGSDLVPMLAEEFAERGYSVFFLGAKEGVAQEAADRLCKRFPALRVAGVYAPPMNFGVDNTLNDETLRRLKEAAPDICFVALGSPKQEYWMHDCASRSGVPVMLGIGAGLDFIAGVSQRAPRWVQRCGLEWFWRLVHEPRRLWKRYLIEDQLFVVLLAREIAGRFRGRA